jgi:hypothetical protein
MKIDTKLKLFYLTVFALITCIVEAFLQIHSINIYHPSGFEFPLIIISDKIFSTEFRREICTVLILVLISVIFWGNSIQKLSYLILSFVIWDMAHDAGLKECLKSSLSFVNIYLPQKQVSYWY